MGLPLISCVSAKSTKEANVSGTRTTASVDASLPTRWNYTAQEVQSLCDAEQKQLLARLDKLGKLSPDKANFKNSFGELEAATSEFSNNVSPLVFLKDVGTDEKVRDASSACSEKIGQLMVSIFAREDLYRVVKAGSAKNETLDYQSNRLVEETLEAFKRNGLELSPDHRALLVKKRQEIISKEESYQKRIKQMTSGFVLAKASELDGLSAEFIQGLPKTADGQYKIGMDKASVFPVLENAKSEALRKRVSTLYDNLGGPENVKDLEEAIQLRDEAAHLLGFRNHAHYVLDRQMAKTPEKVMAFLDPLVEKLKIKGRQDLQTLISLKQKEHPSEAHPKMNTWDWRYYENQWKKQKFHIDNQQIKEYFPIEVVLKGMFDIYQTLFGVKFVEVADSTVWEPSVKTFRIERDGKTIAYFYMDLFPREGKYNHFAAFDIYKAYAKDNGVYRAPVSAIVGNFSKPSKDAPSLLEHEEVETIFHEFGHIMHQTLTTARYASLSGTSVKTDFVEAPSQMLENWVWENETLSKMSGYYKDTSKHLPAKLVRHMIDAKNVNSGIFWLRQAAFALIDMKYHTASHIQGKSTEIYADTIEKTMLIPIQSGTIPQAGFGHLMGGYDAGYYGYLWSKVYAQDMFTRFEKEGLLNPKTGADYLHNILEPGGTKDPYVLITAFLGRQPNHKAFLKSLGLEDHAHQAKLD